MKKAILLSSCGAAIYSLLPNLVVTAKPSNKNYRELIAVMNEHQNPKPLVTVERYKFNKGGRHPGESIEFYVTKIECLSEHCDFGLNLDDMIRDRLVCGMRNTKIQQHLFVETKLSLEGALKIACTMERAKKIVCDI